MAAAAAQQMGMIQERQGEPIAKWTKPPLFGDVPTSDGNLRLEMARTFLHQQPAGGSTLGANVEGLDPGVGGGGNATVQAQHTDRNIRSRETLLSMIDPSSNLHSICSAAPFTTGVHIWDYLPGAVYLRPDNDEAQEHIRKVQAWTWEDLPPEQKDENLVLHFKAKILGYNPMKHPNMNINNAGLITIFCNGLHPQAKVEALKMRGNLVLAAQNNCCFPNQYAPGHPLAGNVHPNAGALSLDLLGMHVHREFTRNLRAGIFRLKGQPSVNLTTDESGASARSVPDEDAPDASPLLCETANDDDGFVYASLMDVYSNGLRNFYDYAVYVLNRETRLRTCKNCGGVNHFSHKDGVLICPTPENSVDTGLLSRIRYPIGVYPWRFSGRGGGKGKGKGKGKGGRYGKGGRRNGGRGAFLMDPWYFPAPTSEEQRDEGSSSQHSQNYVSDLHDDYDGWNQ